MKKKIMFVKTAARKLVLATTKEHAEYVKERVLTDGRTKQGWRAHVTGVEEKDIDVTVDTGKVDDEGKPVLQKKIASYEFYLEVGLKSKRPRREDVIAKEFVKINEIVSKALKSKGWEVVSVEDLPDDYVIPGTEQELADDAAAEEAKAKAKEAKTKEETHEEVLTEVSPAPVLEEVAVEV